MTSSPADRLASHSRLLSRAELLPVCVGTLLATATIFECHAAYLPSLIYSVVLWLWWAAVAQIFWVIIRKWPQVVRFSAKNMVLQFTIGLVVTTLHLVALQSTANFIVHMWPSAVAAGWGDIRFMSIDRFGLEFLVYSLLWTACAVARITLVAQQEAMRSLELQQQLSAAQLRALQMQLEPHFLFNTLNAITALVDMGRNTEASATLLHLNRILKATLSRSRPDRVSLATELEMVENYLAIEQVRFADRLRVEMRVDPSALDGLVPCFLLQPIVENAIRHGIAQREENGLVTTLIERKQDQLHLRVRDNGPGFSLPAQPGHGIGLKNTEERLAHFYPSRYNFKVSEPESGGFEVAITIPYECAPS
jgi:two-component sensor histidine kinase